MKVRLIMPVVLYLSVLTTVGSAQTVAEQMQKAIYCQETTGDVEGAIRIYRGILASTPSRELGAQAQFRLAQTLLQKGDLQNAALEFQILSQSYPEFKDLIASMASHWRPGVRPVLGVLQNRRYRNSLTNVELPVPEGWSFLGDTPSSDNGQIATLESGSGITVLVWMRSQIVGAPDLAATLHKAMEDKPSMRSKGWKIRPESVRERILRGHHGLSAIADYTVNGMRMVEFDYWVFSGTTHVFFFGQAEEKKLEALQTDIETVAKSALIP